MKNNILTGVFVIVAATLLLFLAYHASTQFFSKPGERFYADFPTVGLLEGGSPVALGGMSVGKVESIQDVWHDDGTFSIRVTFTVHEDVAGRLRKGTTAKIAPKSMLGGNYVALANGPGPGAPEKTELGYRLDSIEPDNMFALLEKTLKDDLGPILESAKRVLDNVNGKLDQLEMQKVDLLLDNANGLLTDGRSAVQNLDRRLSGSGGTLDRTDKLLDETTTLVTDLQGRVEVLQRDVTELIKKAGVTADTATEALTSVDDLVKNDIKTQVNAVGDSATKLLTHIDEKVDPLMAKLDSLMTSAQDVLESRDLYGTLYEARYALREFKLLARSIRADPSQVIFGGPGEEGLLPKEQPKYEKDLRRSGRGARYGY